MLARLLLLVVIACAFALPVLAEPAQPGWIADPTNGCRVWNPSPHQNESISWSGPCVNGLAHGRGVLQWFVDGKPAQRTEAEYRNGKLSGWSTITWAGGARYEGEWKDGQRYGWGTQIFASGDRYEGEWKNGKPDGRGQLKRDGNVYEGEWKDGMPNGRGRLIKPDGQIYDGNWSNGCYRQGDRKAWIIVSAKDCGFE